MQWLDAEFLVERFETCLSSEEVGAVFSSAVQPYGFVAISAGQSSPTPAGRDWKFFFNTWPQEWLTIYQERNYVRIDPLPLYARFADGPLTWLEWGGLNAGTPEQQGLGEWVNTLGLRDGFAVPIHYPGDDLGLCVTVANRPIDGAAEKRALHLASLYALQRCRKLSAPRMAAAGKSPLTDRERACMRWVIEGKSDRDIGDILGISRTTVHFHVEQVKRKLSVRTRMQAARIVVSFGYA